MEFHREEKREGGDRGDQEEKGSQKDRQIQPVISSLSVLHSPEHPKRFTDLGREEKGEGEDRGELEKKRRVKRGETNQASKLTPK